MNWRIKGVLQRVLGAIPFGDRAHFLLQCRAGGLADFDRECDSKVDDWKLMMGHLRSAGAPIAGATIVEMGTGWYPAFPVCLYFAGALRVVTLDLNRHLVRRLALKLATRLRHHIPAIASAAGCLEEDVAVKQATVAEALQRGASIEIATNGVIAYRAPADAGATGLPSASVDIVFSNSVLEHVPPSVIERCFAESFRILRPGGVIFHSVNCGDHYAYVDPDIHQLHYLQYSDAQWARWNNRFLYQNRLRAIDFTSLAHRAGFTIEVDTSTVKSERLAQLNSMVVDPCFGRYTPEQLALTTIDFVARKPPE